MNQFIEVLASKRSISKRKLNQGVGVNDADYQISSAVNGKRVTCPFYRKWADMLKRCYSDRYLKTHPTYAECKCCSEWLTFSAFKSWMKSQDWQGKQLDKDIKYTGNKIYSPDTCIFVTDKINLLLNSNLADRGRWPRGVCLNNQSNKFHATCKVNGKNKHLGMFLTPEEASVAYREFKSALIMSVAESQGQPLRGYLIRISKEFNPKEATTTFV